MPDDMWVNGAKKSGRVLTCLTSVDRGWVVGGPVQTGGDPPAERASGQTRSPRSSRRRASGSTRRARPTPGRVGGWSSDPVTTARLRSTRSTPPMDYDSDDRPLAWSLLLLLLALSDNRRETCVTSSLGFRLDRLRYLFAKFRKGALSEPRRGAPGQGAPPGTRGESLAGQIGVDR